MSRPAASTEHFSKTRERTRTDFEDVCLRAGLSLTAVTPLPEAAPFSLIEAVTDR